MSQELLSNWSYKPLNLKGRFFRHPVSLLPVLDDSLFDLVTDSIVQLYVSQIILI